MGKFKWSAIAAIAGLIVGAFAAKNYGVTYPTEVLGFAIPYIGLFLIVGLIIDLFAAGKK